MHHSMHYCHIYRSSVSGRQIHDGSIAVSDSIRSLAYRHRFSLCSGPQDTVPRRHSSAIRREGKGLPVQLGRSHASDTFRSGLFVYVGLTPQLPSWGSGKVITSDGRRALQPRASWGHRYGGGPDPPLTRLAHRQSVPEEPGDHPKMIARLDQRGNRDLTRPTRFRRRAGYMLDRHYCYPLVWQIY